MAPAPSLVTREGRRSPRSARAAAFVAVVAVGLTLAGHATADEKEVCITASEKAQQLRNAGKLTRAREELASCSRTECPKLIQKDCTQWMSELLTALPSIVPAAKDRAGRDVVDTRVTVDGQLVTSSLDGTAIVVDPGIHALRFETSGAPPVDEKVVVKPGEKNRIVTVTFAKGDDGAARGGTPGTRGEAATTSPPVAAYVVGGVGIAALGAALFIQLAANSDARELRDTCAPGCNPADVDDIRSRYTVAGVTAGVGGALLVAGVVMFFLHGSGSGGSSSSATSRDAARTKSSFLSFRPGASGGATLLRF